MVSLSPSCSRRRIIGAVRRHCQTMALYTGSPVSRSQTMAVSRWLVMPMASTSAADRPDFSKAAPKAWNWVPAMSMGSCSTQPGLG